MLKVGRTSVQQVGLASVPILGSLIRDWTHGLRELSVRSSAMYQTGSCVVSIGARRPAALATSLTKTIAIVYQLFICCPSPTQIVMVRT